MRIFHFKYILNDTIENFKNQKYVNFLSIIIILFTFLIINVFFYLQINISDFTKKFASEYKGEVFLNSNINKENILSKLQSEKLIKSSKFINSDTAKKSFVNSFPELKQMLNEVGGNPFPPSVEISFKTKNREKITALINNLKTRTWIKEIKTNMSIIGKLKGIKKTIILVGVFFGSILLFTSFFTIVNIIKILAYSRKEEVKILKMVGASNWYIELPLILNGMFLGLAGMLLSIVFFKISQNIIPLYLKDFHSFIKPILFNRQLSLNYYIIMLVAAGSIGSFSSYTSVSKFLRAEEENY